MDKKLFFQAITKFLLGVAIVGLLIFVPAGTMEYWNGWLCMGLLFIIAYILYAEVLRENTYLSRTIEVQENQKVINTGLYGIVRHPMNMATILLFLTMPLVLGSIISFIIFLVYPLIIAKRIKNEEEVLERDLKGYSEYKKKVKYKLIPFVL